MTPPAAAAAAANPKKMEQAASRAAADRLLAAAERYHRACLDARVKCQPVIAGGRSLKDIAGELLEAAMAAEDAPIPYGTLHSAVVPAWNAEVRLDQASADAIKAANRALGAAREYAMECGHPPFKEDVID